MHWIRYVFQRKNGIRAVYLHFAVFQRQEEKTFGPLMRKNAHFSFPAFNKMRVDSTMLVALVWSPRRELFVVLRGCTVAGGPINDFTKGCFGYPAM